MPEKGVYLLSFDIHTNDKENRVEVYENDKLIKSFIFKSAYGKVEEFIYFDEEEIMIKFTGDKERWMKVLNIYITKDNLIIPVYSYPLLPNSAKSYLNIKGLLMYSNRVSYKKNWILLTQIYLMIFRFQMLVLLSIQISLQYLIWRYFIK